MWYNYGVVQGHHTPLMLVSINDFKFGEIYYVDTLENERGTIKSEEIKSITLAYTLTGKQMRKNFLT